MKATIIQEETRTTGPMSITPTTEAILTEGIKEEHTHKGNQGITKTQGRITMGSMIDMRRFLKRSRNLRENHITLMKKIMMSLKGNN